MTPREFLALATLLALVFLSTTAGCDPANGGSTMKRIDTPHSTGTLQGPAGSGTGHFQDTDPNGGTEMSAEWCEGIQEEVASVIEGLGGTLTGDETANLWTLLRDPLTVAGTWSEKIQVGRDPEVMPASYLTTIDVEETGPLVYKGAVQTGRVYANDGFYTGYRGAAVERITAAGNAILVNVLADRVTADVLTETDALWIAEQADMGGEIPTLKTIILTRQIYTDGVLAFPLIADAAQRLYRIRNAGVGNLILTKRTGTSETIEGADSFTIATGKCAAFVATPGDWKYINRD